MFNRHARKIVSFILSLTFVLAYFVLVPNEVSADSNLELGKVYSITQSDYKPLFDECYYVYKYTATETGYYSFEHNQDLDLDLFVEDPLATSGYKYVEREQAVSVDDPVRIQRSAKSMYFLLSGKTYYISTYNSGVGGSGKICLDKVANYFTATSAERYITGIKNKSFTCAINMYSTVQFDSITYHWSGAGKHSDEFNTSEITVNFNDMLDDNGMFADGVIDGAEGGDLGATNIECLIEVTYKGIGYYAYVDFIINGYSSAEEAESWARDINNSYRYTIMYGSDYDFGYPIFEVSAGSTAGDCAISYQWYKVNRNGSRVKLDGQEDCCFYYDSITRNLLGEPDFSIDDDSECSVSHSLVCIVTFKYKNVTITKELEYQIDYMVQIIKHCEYDVVVAKRGDKITLPDAAEVFEEGRYVSGYFEETTMPEGVTYNYKWVDCITVPEEMDYSIIGDVCDVSDYIESYMVLGTGKNLKINTSSLTMHDEKEGKVSYVACIEEPCYNGRPCSNPYFENGYVVFKIYYKSLINPDVSGIAVNSTNFPDAAFREYVSKRIDRNQSGYLTEEEISSVQYINVEGLGIADLTGIQYFTETTSLNCQKNKLTSLDLTGLDKLYYLNFSHNKVSKIDLTAMKELEYLVCGYNKLKYINLTKNTGLITLECNNNQLTKLNLTGNKILEFLRAEANPGLTTLNLDKCPMLKSVYKNGPYYQYVAGVDVFGEVEYFEEDDVYSGNTGVILDSAVVVENVKPFFWKYVPILSIVNEPDGFQISWNAIVGASKYKVYKKIGDANWKAIKTTTDLSYLDKNVTEGGEYTYAVVCLDSEGKAMTSKANELYVVYYAPVSRVPQLTISVEGSGIYLWWDVVQGAAKYRIYRKAEGETKWTTLKTTNMLSYTDNAVVNGKTYYYGVVAIDEDGNRMTDGVQNEISIKYVSGVSVVPELDAFNDDLGVKLNWTAVDGAAKYRVFRKAEGETKWTTIKTTTGLEFTDKNVTAGSTYTYGVVCLDAEGKRMDSGVNNAVSIKYEKMNDPYLPVISAQNADSGISLEWTSVEKAASYKVYRKASEGDKWKEIKNTANRSFLDEGVASGVTYYYCVVAYDKNGTRLGKGTGNQISITADIKSDAPAVDLTSANNGIQVSWTAVEGAVKYRIYRKAAGDNKWSTLKTTTALSFVDTNVEDGVEYIYGVVGIDGSGANMSTAAENQKSIVYSVPAAAFVEAPDEAAVVEVSDEEAVAEVTE